MNKLIKCSIQANDAVLSRNPCISDAMARFWAAPLKRAFISEDGYAVNSGSMQNESIRTFLTYFVKQS